MGGYPYSSAMGAGKGWAQHEPVGKIPKLHAAESSLSSSEVRSTSNPNMPLQASGRASGDIKVPLLKRQEIICIQGKGRGIWTKVSDFFFLFFQDMSEGSN